MINNYIELNGSVPISQKTHILDYIYCLLRGKDIDNEFCIYWPVTEACFRYWENVIRYLF